MAAKPAQKRSVLLLGALKRTCWSVWPQTQLRHYQLLFSRCIFSRYGVNRCTLTLCFPRRLKLRHKLHFEQWKKSSFGPILRRKASGQGRLPLAFPASPSRTCRSRTRRSGTASCRGRRGGRCRSNTPRRGCGSPRSAAGPAAVPGKRPLGALTAPPPTTPPPQNGGGAPKMAAPPDPLPPRTHLLQETAAGALHLGHTEAVQPVPLGAIVAQPAGVELPAARRLRTAPLPVKTRPACPYPCPGGPATASPAAGSPAGSVRSPPPRPPPWSPPPGPDAVITSAFRPFNFRRFRFRRYRPLSPAAVCDGAAGTSKLAPPASNLLFPLKSFFIPSLNLHFFLSFLLFSSPLPKT